jgi:hypothetical protein
MTAVKKQYPELAVVGANFDADPSLVSFFQRGKHNGTAWMA